MDKEPPNYWFRKTSKNNVNVKISEKIEEDNLKIDKKTNKKLKLIPFIQKEKKPLDLRHRNLFKKLAETREKQRKERFQKWLRTYTYDDILVKEILIFLINGIKENLNLYGYKIIDEKKLRDEVATYIYKLS